MRNFWLCTYLLTVLILAACDGGNTAGRSGMDTSVELADGVGIDVQPRLEDTGISTDEGSAVVDTSAIADDGEAPVDVVPPSDVAIEEDAGSPEPPAAIELPSGLVGEAGDTTFAPVYTGVVNQEGESVLADQLLGHWTVLWFYPFASTFG